MVPAYPPFERSA